MAYLAPFMRLHMPFYLFFRFFHARCFGMIVCVFIESPESRHGVFTRNVCTIILTFYDAIFDPATQFQAQHLTLQHFLQNGRP